MKNNFNEKIVKSSLIFFFLFFFFHITSFPQNQKYVLTNKSGDSIYYYNDGSTKTFNTIGKDGKLINRGKIGSYTGFKDDNEFFSFGEFDVFPNNEYLNYPKGIPSFSAYYKMINSKLNGIHYVGGLETVNNEYTFNPDKNFLIIIDNNIVDSNFERNKNNREARYVIEYRNWKETSLEVESFMGLGIRSSPKLHEVEKLYYDLELMVNIFIDDFISHFEHALKEIDIFNKNKDQEVDFKLIKIQLESLKNLLKNNLINSVFEELGGDTIATSQGLGYDNEINIKVDPKNWINSSLSTRWYILYHELGHDVLNLKHGQGGGRMMFNYPTKNYSWEDFFNDRHDMFIYYLEKNYPKIEIFLP